MGWFFFQQYLWKNNGSDEWQGWFHLAFDRTFHYILLLHFNLTCCLRINNNDAGRNNVRLVVSVSVSSCWKLEFRVLLCRNVLGCDPSSHLKQTSNEVIKAVTPVYRKLATITQNLICNLKWTALTSATPFWMLNHKYAKLRWSEYLFWNDHHSMHHEVESCLSWWFDWCPPCPPQPSNAQRLDDQLRQPPTALVHQLKTNASLMTLSCRSRKKEGRQPYWIAHYVRTEGKCSSFIQLSAKLSVNNDCSTDN